MFLGPINRLAKAQLNLLNKMTSPLKYIYMREDTWSGNYFLLKSNSGWMYWYKINLSLQLNCKICSFNANNGNTTFNFLDELPNDKERCNERNDDKSV